MPRFKAPEVAVQRLSLYLRTLKSIPDDRVLSSQKFAELVGTTDNQIRKDLSYFGWFGIRGQGYRVDRLKEEITHILTLNRKWRLALVGVGKLGSALLMYPGFRKDKFQIKLAFDSDPEKIGKTIGGIVIQDVEKIISIKEGRVVFEGSPICFFNNKDHEILSYFPLKQECDQSFIIPRRHNSPIIKFELKAFGSNGNNVGDGKQ